MNRTVIVSALASVVCAASIWIVLQSQHELLNDAFDAGRDIGKVEGIRTLECDRDGGDWCEKLKLIQPYADCFHQHAPRVGVCESLIR